MKDRKKAKLIENLQAVVSMITAFVFLTSLIMAYKVDERYAIFCLISPILGGLLIGILRIFAPKRPKHKYSGGGCDHVSYGSYDDC